MITWGISANSHNASLAVFEDDELLFASDTERFSKIKNDPHLNNEIIDYASMIGGSPDLICWYEKPWLKTLRQLCAGQGWQDNNIKAYLEKFDIHAPIKTYKHHFTHATGAYFTSPFDRACVIIIDAIGEFETLTIWNAQGKKLKKVYSCIFPDSLGLFYSAMTQRCGLKPNEEEYILMGMSAYGDKKRLHKKIVDDFLMFPSPGSFSPIMFKKNLHRGCKWWAPELSSQQDLFDIAAATQYIYEKTFVRILQLAKELVDSDNLVLGGGCALNCVANPLAYEYYDNVYIPPCPGDNGSSIGAVLANRLTHIENFNPFIGTNISPKANNDTIVEYLLKNQICGLARGRAEFGPRALGNRSLLADPRDHAIKDRVNEIKKREKFRPFAPAILEEHASEYFYMPSSKSPYMQHVVTCKNPDKFPAIVHVDGTSRVQTVGKNDNKEFRNLLEIWYAKTGCPMLLNTSLNIKGQPMINDIIDAFNWSKTYGLPVFN